MTIAPPAREAAAKHPALVSAHLDALLAKVPQGHGLVLSGPRNGRMCRLSDELVTLENLGATTDRLTKTPAQHVYVMVCPVAPDTWADVLRRPNRGARGGAADVSAVTHLWADLDVAGPNHVATALPPTIEAALGIIASLPQPTYVASTGGGLHAYWRLSAPMLITDEASRAEAKALTTGWVKLVGQLGAAQGWRLDDGVGDLARVLRLWGTTNTKTSPTTAATLHDIGQWPPGLAEGAPWCTGVEYDASAMSDIIATRYRDKERRARQADQLRGDLPRAKRTKTKSTTGPGLDILDALDALPWSAIWPDGWVHVGDEGDAELWQRPGANTPYSAKCWPDACKVWSEQIDGLPVIDGGYTRSDVMSWRLFGAPDRSRLAKAMAAQRRHTQYTHKPTSPLAERQRP